MVPDFRKNRSALDVPRLVTFTLRSVAIVLVVAGVVLVGVSGASIQSSRADVPTATVALGPRGETPALHLRAPQPPLGTVVVVHGFAGSKEFMRSMDYSLARAGFDVYGVDLPGHGRSPLRLDNAALSSWFSELLADMRSKGQFTVGELYLVGHSLGTLVVTRGALANPDLGIRGVVALSPIFADITATEPANYLALFGESEIGGVRETALKALRAGTGLEDPTLETIYGDAALGTARGAAMVRQASHISIADARVAISSTIAWLRSAAGSPITESRLEQGRAERSFGFLGAALLLLGAFYYGAGAIGLLGHAPRRPEATAIVEEARVTAGLPAKPTAEEAATKPASLPEGVQKARERATQLLSATRVIPLLYALATAVAAVFVGFVGTFSFLRQSGTDYLSLYLLVFALIVAPLIPLTTRLIRCGPLVNTRTRLGVPLSVGLGVALFLVVLVLIGWYATFAWSAVWPPVFRWPLILLLAVLFLPFSIIDELVRSTVHDRAGFSWVMLVSVMGKLMMVVTWYAGLFLPHPSQAMVVVAPIVVSLLILLDFLGTMFYNEHGSWLAGAVFKALTLAWLAGAVFPLVK